MNHAKENCLVLRFDSFCGRAIAAVRVLVGAVEFRSTTKAFGVKIDSRARIENLAGWERSGRA